MLRRPVKPKDRLPEPIADAMAATQRLPFARRDLLRSLGSKAAVEEALTLLQKKKLIHDYPPLVEKKGVRVAQTEHTIFIHEDHAEVLTRAPEGS